MNENLIKELEIKIADYEAKKKASKSDIQKKIFQKRIDEWQRDLALYKGERQVPEYSHTELYLQDLLRKATNEPDNKKALRTIKESFDEAAKARNLTQSERLLVKSGLDYLNRALGIKTDKALEEKSAKLDKPKPKAEQNKLPQSKKKVISLDDFINSFSLAHSKTKAGRNSPYSQASVFGGFSKGYSIGSNLTRKEVRKLGFENKQYETLEDAIKAIPSNFPFLLHKNIEVTSEATPSVSELKNESEKDRVRQMLRIFIEKEVILKEFSGKEKGWYSWDYFKGTHKFFYAESDETENVAHLGHFHKFDRSKPVFETKNNEKAIDFVMKNAKMPTSNLVEDFFKKHYEDAFLMYSQQLKKELDA